MPTQSVKHLLFYDGSCGLCDHAVQFVLHQDKQEIFLFAPLQGNTAKKVIGVPMEEDSLLFIENYGSIEEKRYILGKGAFRILWNLGGLWTLPGLLSFLPSWSYDWAYRLVAKNRHKIFGPEACLLPDPKYKERFLN